MEVNDDTQYTQILSHIHFARTATHTPRHAAASAYFSPFSIVCVYGAAANRCGLWMWFFQRQYAESIPSLYLFFSFSSDVDADHHHHAVAAA